MTRLRQTLGLIGWILLTFLAPLGGAFSPPGAWYQTLNKPDWNPPAWIFGPVWTVLYMSMAVAAWLVWRRGGFQVQKRPLTLFLIQLGLNAAWTPVFFGAHQIGASLIVLVALCLAVLLTWRAFAAVQRLPGLLFIPYLAWVCFAAWLNFTLWRINA